MASSSPPPSPGGHRRRSSIIDLFTSTPSASSSNNTQTGTSPIAAGSSQDQRRGMSITTMGLNGNSPIAAAFAKQRRSSASSSTASGSPEFRNSFTDEAVVIEEEDQMGPPLNTPATPSFGRRASFGAQALRDVRKQSTPGGRRPSSSLFTHRENVAPLVQDGGPSSPARKMSAVTGGEGFNWSDALRDKTKRSPSVSGPGNTFGMRPRANSSGMEPPKEMPVPQAAPAKMKKPDQLGERMLRGDFMMD